MSDPRPWTDPNLDDEVEREAFLVWVKAFLTRLAGIRTPSGAFKWASHDILNVHLPMVVAFINETYGGSAPQPAEPPYPCLEMKGRFDTSWEPDSISDAAWDFPFVRMGSYSKRLNSYSQSRSLFSWYGLVRASAESCYINYGGAHYWLLDGAPSDPADILGALQGCAMVLVTTVRERLRPPSPDVSVRAVSGQHPPRPSSLTAASSSSPFPYNLPRERATTPSPNLLSSPLVAPPSSAARTSAPFVNSVHIVDRVVSTPPPSSSPTSNTPYNL